MITVHKLTGRNVRKGAKMDLSGISVIIYCNVTVPQDTANEHPSYSAISTSQLFFLCGRVFCLRVTSGNHFYHEKGR